MDFWKRFGTIFYGFPMDFGSFFGSKNLFTCSLDVSYSEGERSERASAASDVSGAMELPRLGTDRQTETDRHTDTRKDGNTKKQTDSGKLEANNALPVHLPRQVWRPRRI